MTTSVEAHIVTYNSAELIEACRLLPLEVLEQNNALTMFGLHRRLRGAALGHLAAFEATSSLPSRRMAEGLRRLGFPEEMAAYYDEHVEADAVHEQLAVRTIAGGLLDEEPDAVPEAVDYEWPVEAIPTQADLLRITAGQYFRRP